MHINTNDNSVLKERIILYFQRINVINPATGRKNEYQSLVSPIVRIGGLSNEIHILNMKVKKRSSPIDVRSTAFL